VWQIFAFTLFAAITWSINNPVRQALVPNLVPKRDLLNAIALNSVGFNSLKVIGPALGGLLIVWFGAGRNFLIQASTYTFVIALFFLMRVPPTPPNARRSSATANLKEGIVYVWNTPTLRALLIASLVPPIFVFPAAQWLLPVIQKDILHVGPEGLGMLMAGEAAGAVIGTLILAATGSRVRRHGLWLVAVIALMGLGVMIFSQMDTLPSAVLILVFIGLAQTVYYTFSSTMLQLIVPDELRGRVNSIFMADFGIGPAGTLLAGVSIEFIGAPTTILFLGLIVALLAAALLWKAPDLWRLRS
jgi:predicted MFS family arabinose efflux permease